MNTKTKASPRAATKRAGAGPSSAATPTKTGARKTAQDGAASRAKPRAKQEPSATKPAPLSPSKIVGILESQRQLGGASYPPTLARLAELSGEKPAAVKKALGEKDATVRVLLSRAPGKPEDTLVLLQEDVDAIARSDRFLHGQIQSARTDEVRAIGVPGLCKGLQTALAGAFNAALLERIETKRIPSAVGVVRGEPALFFFVADAVLPSMEALPAHAGAAAISSTTAQHAEPSPALLGARSFAARFDDAFAALDREGGGHNYVTLGALRARLADVPRHTFDAELSTLRRERRYTLDPSDGRHRRMTEVERDAGIMEAGNLLVYVARRSDA